MKKGLLISLICAFVLCFALVGCGGNDSSDPAAKFVGDWAIESIDSDDPNSAVSAEDMELAKAFGMDVKLSLKADMTGEMDLFGSVIPITWEATADGASVTVEGAPCDMEINGSTLSLVMDGDSMNFKKA